MGKDGFSPSLSGESNTPFLLTDLACQPFASIAFQTKKGVLLQFYSTENRDVKVGLKQAILEGMPKQGGLYMPCRIDKMDNSFFEDITRLTFGEISYLVAKKLLEGEVADRELEKLVKESINFDAPLVQLAENTFVLELFHGPTLAFKDFGARFMARFMSYLLVGEKRELTIITATSGDTGSAVANGFYGIDKIRVVILFPKGKVSKLQEAQLTTFGNNIHTLEVDGDFDKCQQLAKAALTDKSLQKRLFLSSANSINISRLFPQVFYYFWAYAQLARVSDKPFVISVPSGNFGNLTACCIAKKMGLPAEKIVAATNINDVVPNYLKTGEYRPKPTKHTISNAMDVGNPSNFVRLLELYEKNHNVMKKDIVGFRFTDKQTKENMDSVFRKYGYILDPHGSVAHLGISQIEDIGLNKIFLETAHPAKFPDVIQSTIGVNPRVPHQLKKLFGKKQTSTKIKAEYSLFKKFLLGL